jgi:hypothetical protein
MTEADVKDAVRERDGCKCRICGVSNDDHFEHSGRQLDVHRLLPGCEYQPALCVTLCRKCHAAKPRKLEDAIFGDPDETGLFVIFFSLYNDFDRHVIETLRSEGERTGRSFTEVLDQVLKDFCAGIGHDYCI